MNNKEKIEKELEEEGIKFQPKFGMFSAVPYIEALLDKLIKERQAKREAERITEQFIEKHKEEL